MAKRGETGNDGPRVVDRRLAVNPGFGLFGARGGAHLGSRPQISEVFLTATHPVPLPIGNGSTAVRSRNDVTTSRFNSVRGASAESLAPLRGRSSRDLAGATYCRGKTMLYTCAMRDIALVYSVSHAPYIVSLSCLWTSSM
jgi:hypothetical protein